MAHRRRAKQIPCICLPRQQVILVVFPMLRKLGSGRKRCESGMGEQVPDGSARCFSYAQSMHGLLEAESICHQMIQGEHLLRLRVLHPGNAKMYEVLKRIVDTGPPFNGFPCMVEDGLFHTVRDVNGKAKQHGLFYRRLTFFCNARSSPGLYSSK